MSGRKITLEEVWHLSRLANLHLTNQEAKVLSEQLSQVIEHMRQLDEVDTSDVAATSQTTGLTNVFQSPDYTAKTFTAEQALSGTEETHNDYFLVSAILEKDKQ